MSTSITALASPFKLGANRFGTALRHQNCGVHSCLGWSWPGWSAATTSFTRPSRSMVSRIPRQSRLANYASRSQHHRATTGRRKSGVPFRTRHLRKLVSRPERLRARRRHVRRRHVRRRLRVGRRRARRKLRGRQRHARQSLRDESLHDRRRQRRHADHVRQNVRFRCSTATKSDSRCAGSRERQRRSLFALLQQPRTLPEKTSTDA